MNILKTTAFLLCLFCLTACSEKVENRPVTKPIAPDRLAEIEKKNPRFVEMYERVQDLRSRLGADEMMEYESLTYSELYNFCIYVEENEDKLRADAAKAWTDLCEGYALRLDSVHEYWKGWYEKNRLESQVEVRCLEATPFNYDEGFRNLRVRIHNRSGKPLDALTYAFSVADSGKEPLCHSAGSSNSYMGLDKQSYTGHIDKEAEQYIGSQPYRVDDWQALVDCPPSKLYENYSFAYQIFSITRNGETITAEDVYNEIPESAITMTPLWRTCMSESCRLSYLDTAMQTLFGISLPDKEAYKQQCYYDALAEVNETASVFYSLLMDE